MNENISVGVVGLGYVGLPLALEFGKYYKTYGYDLSEHKIDSYRRNIDPNGEMQESDFKLSRFFNPTNETNFLQEVDFIIIAVPTPVDSSNNPDFKALKSASVLVGKNIKKGVTIIYESTVYPGATEELCLPILEEESKLTWKKDFNIGYSPERINPGDKERTLTKIVKVVSGDNDFSLDKISNLYDSIIEAGVYRATSIKVAEAAKVIENTQRDLNIALVNELAHIFNIMDIDTLEVLEAAGTKWNFLPFKPGLVGGHCIGVDPYYLTYKAEQIGYHPQVILSGRKINDEMAGFVASEIIKTFLKKNYSIKEANVIILGITFKENCSDVRNSKVIDLYNELNSYGLNIFIYDPVACPINTFDTYGIKLTEWEDLPESKAIVSAVAHEEIKSLDINKLQLKLIKNGLFFDLKGVAQRDIIESSGYYFWRL